MYGIIDTVADVHVRAGKTPFVRFRATHRRRSIGRSSADARRSVLKKKKKTLAAKSSLSGRGFFVLVLINFSSRHLALPWLCALTTTAPVGCKYFSTDVL